MKVGKVRKRSPQSQGDNNWQHYDQNPTDKKTKTGECEPAWYICNNPS